MLYKVTLYANDKKGLRFRLEWLIEGGNGEACRAHIEAGLDAFNRKDEVELVHYGDRSWKVKEIKTGVYALPTFAVPTPAVPAIVSGDGEHGA